MLLWERAFCGIWYLMLPLLIFPTAPFCIFYWSDSLSLTLEPQLWKVCFSENREAQKAPEQDFKDIYLSPAILLSLGSGLQHKGHNCLIRPPFDPLITFFEEWWRSHGANFVLYLALFHICWTPCLPISCSSVWPRPHLCHIFTTKSAEKSNKESFQLFFQESQAALGPTTQRPACKFFTCFLRLVSGSAGAPAPIQCLLAARLPCSIFFWQHPENRLEPPPRPAFSPAFSAAGRGGSGGPALPHTSHMGDTWLCLALSQLWMLSASC